MLKQRSVLVSTPCKYGTKCHRQLVLHVAFVQGVSGSGKTAVMGIAAVPILYAE